MMDGERMMVTPGTIEVEVEYRAGVYRWTNNGQPVPLDEWARALPGWDEERQWEAIEKSNDEFLVAYRKRMAERSPEEIAEQRAEARAAFGPGEAIVNVITGERYTT